MQASVPEPTQGAAPAGAETLEARRGVCGGGGGTGRGLGGIPLLTRCPASSGLASPCAAFCPRSPLAQGVYLPLSFYRRRDSGLEQAV